LNLQELQDYKRRLLARYSSGKNRDYVALDREIKRVEKLIRAYSHKLSA